MIQIRFHGRGGQGAQIASRLLADAAFLEGKDVQSYPFFGVERRGAPVTAFTKIDSRPIRDKSMIYEPDFVVVMDPSLITAIDVTAGLKPEGMILVNADTLPEEIMQVLGDAKVVLVDASAIATAHGLGSKENPIVNTAILGAFARLSKVVGLDAVKQAIDQNVPRKVDKNKDAAIEAWTLVEEKEGSE